MASPGLSIPVARLREAAAARAASSSLRTLAREVGVSYSAARDFLRGSEPYSENLRKLTEWYLRTSSGIDEEAVRAAFRVILHALPEGLRQEGSI